MRRSVSTQPPRRSLDWAAVLRGVLEGFGLPVAERCLVEGPNKSGAKKSRATRLGEKFRATKLQIIVRTNLLLT